MPFLVRIVGIFLLLVPLWGQRYLFKDYRQDSGLANLVVTAMLQDRNNLLWIGTQNGLFRYDGSKMEVIGREGEMGGIFVLSLAEGPDGAIWVNSHQGLGRVYGNKAELDRSFLEGTEELFLGLAVAPNGDLFASTQRGILIGRRAGAKFTYSYYWLRLSAEQSSRPIRQIAVDKQSRAWFGCGKGLCRARSLGEVEYFSKEVGLPPDEYSGILFDHKDAMYLRSSQRLMHLDPGASQWQSLSAPVSLRGPQFLASGRSGDLFVPFDGGLATLKSATGRWRIVREDQGIPGDRLSSVLEDHENSIWLGFIGDGAKRWLGYEEWEGYTKRDGLSSASIWAILRDAQGTLWTSTEVGLNVFDPANKRWQPFGGNEGLSWGSIYTMSRGSGDRIFAVSLEKGLIEIDTRTRRHRLWGKPSGVRRAYHVHVDKSGRLWLGTSEGLYVTSQENPLSWRRTSPEDNAGPDTIFTVHEDSSGRIWAGTNHGIVHSIDASAQSWRRITTREGLRSNSVWYAKELRPNEYWAGYLESKGASRLVFPKGPTVDAAPQWMHISERLVGSGPPEFVSYFNGLDKSGLHWMGTDRGVFVAPPGAYQLRHFTDQDGLIWNDCNSNAFFADDDGSVWIGTSRGLAHAKLVHKIFPDPPTLKTRRLVIGNQAFDESEFGSTQPIAVPPSTNLLEWEVSPITFRFESRLLFRFRLQSSGDAWAQRKTNTVAFSNMPAGADAMEAQVKVDRMPWSKPIVIPIEIEASFWKSWPGRIAIALGAMGLIALLIVSIWRHRNKRLLAEKQTLTEAVHSRTQEIQKLLCEAQEANKLKSEFLANMSHEIRTPMNGVLGMLQLIEKGKLEEGQREYVGLAKTSAESLLNLLNEILDLSKVESGQITLEILNFHLGDLLRGAVALLEANARKKGLRIDLDIAVSAERAVLGDPLRLKQVLLNLLGNAIKFTDAGQIRLAVQSPIENEFEFTVSDQGIGIPSEKQIYIFDAFRQADGSTTRRYGGTGLGLAISQRLVQLMGGRIDVESAPGQGSRFHFTIPLASAPELDAPREMIDQETLPHQPLRILVAEDNRINQVVAARMLEAEGHFVQLAADGAEAIESSRRHHFDLILMDVHMPVMDGLRATEEIREWERKQEVAPTKIFALTAGVMNEERARCLAVGMDGFLAKPLTRESLLAALSEAANAAPHRG